MPISSLRGPKILVDLQEKIFNRGFTLLEILVTLFIAALITLALSSGGFVGRERLEEVINTLERTYRFAMDEAVLRNRIVRLHFYLDRNPQEYTVEYGQDAHFVIPSSILARGERRSLQEEEDLQETQQNVNKQFTRIEEFAEGGRKIPENILITGIGSGLHKVLVSEGEISLYIYPDGEKDSSFVAVSDNADLVVMTTDAFTNDMNIEQRPITDITEDNVLEKTFELTKELFDQWIKE